VTRLVHGEVETRQAVAASQALFGRGSLADLAPGTLRAALVEAGLTEVRGAVPSAAALFKEAGLASSLNDARRTIAEGGAYVNNGRITDPEERIGAERLLHGRWLVLRRGKRTVAGVEVVA
jgi:tyrosyl-tRNA synthetase